MDDDYGDMMQRAGGDANVPDVAPPGGGDEQSIDPHTAMLLRAGAGAEELGQAGANRDEQLRDFISERARMTNAHADEETRRKHREETGDLMRSRFGEGSWGNNERNYDMQQRLWNARYADEQSGDTTGQRVLRAVAGVLPTPIDTLTMRDRAQYQNAVNRLREGRPEESDYSVIAEFERHNREAADARSTIGGKVGQTLLHLPGQIMPLMAGGTAASRLVGSSPLISATGGVAANALGQGALRFGATLAATPQMWMPSWQDNNLSAGRDSFDPAGLPAAVAHGALAQAIFGSSAFAGRAASAQVGGGILGRMAQAGAGAATGVIEDQAIQTIGRYAGLTTEYGTLHDLMSGHGAGGREGAIGDLIGQAITFAAFSSMHGDEGAGRNVMESTRKALDRYARDGTAAPEAARALQGAIEPIQEAMRQTPNLSRESALELADRQPDGVLRDLARSVAESLPERANIPSGTPPEVEHTPAMGPETGHEPYLRPPGGPEASAPPRATENAPAPSEGQRWHNTGTEFRDKEIAGPEDHRFEFTGSDGRVYSIDHQDNVGSLDHRIAIRNEAGAEVGHAGFNRNEDGTYSGHVASPGLRGGGRAMYDYAHSAFGEIKPSKADIQGGISLQTPEGRAFWARNAEYARRSAARVLNDPSSANIQTAARDIGSHPADAAVLREAGVTVEGVQKLAKEITTAERALSERGGHEQASLRREIDRAVSEEIAVPQAPSEGARGSQGDNAGEGARPTEVDRGNAEAERGAGPSAAAARGPAGGNFLNQPDGIHDLPGGLYIRKQGRHLTFGVKNGDSVTGTVLTHSELGDIAPGREVRLALMAHPRDVRTYADAVARFVDMIRQQGLVPTIGQHDVPGSDSPARAKIWNELSAILKQQHGVNLSAGPLARGSTRRNELEAAIRKTGLNPEGVAHNVRMSFERGGIEAVNARYPGKGALSQYARMLAAELQGPAPIDIPSAGRAASILSIVKRQVGISEESARKLGWDVDAMRENVPSVFQDHKGKSGRGDPHQIMEWLINEGHVTGDKNDPMLHERLADLVTERAVTMHRDMDRELARDHALYEQEKRDGLRRAIQESGVHPVVAQEALQAGLEAGAREGIKEGVDKGRSSSPEEVHGEHVPPPTPATPSTGGEYVDAAGNLRDASGRVLFHRGAGGNVPNQPGAGGAGPNGPTAGTQATTGPTGKPAGGGLTPAQQEAVSRGILRHNMSIQARKLGVSKRAMLDGEKALDRWVVDVPEATDDAQRQAMRRDRFVQFFDAIEGGKIDTLPPEFQTVARVLRAEMDKRTEAVRQRGLISNDAFIADYMGHLWEKPGLTDEDIGQMFVKAGRDLSGVSKRTLTGSEAFRKERVLPTWGDGIAMGLIPRGGEWNPVRLELMKMAEIDKSVFGRDSVEELKQRNLMVFRPLKSKQMEGWRSVPDKLFKVFAPPEKAVKEFFDKQQMEGLESFARSIGVPVETKMTGPAGMESSSGIVRRFGTPEEVLAHEIGHALDRRYNLSDWANNPSLRPELEALADLRASGQVKPEYQAYLRSPEEMIANLFAAKLHAPDVLNQVAPNAAQVLDSFLQAHAETRPLLDVKPGLELGEREQYMKLAGPMLVGNYVVPDRVANILERYLSPGLRGNKVFDNAMAVGNMLNNFQLGYSAFHMTGTGLNAMFSGMSLGLRQISRGDIAEGAKSFLRGALPAVDVWRAWVNGGKVGREWFKPGSEGADVGRIVDHLVSGGYRFEMDRIWHGSEIEKFQKAFRGALQGKMGMEGLGGAFAHSLQALSELISYPVMRVWVPRMKAGVAMDMARYELSKMPSADLPAIREQLGRAWDSVDNRMGQVVYDNLFWDNLYKDAMHAAVRSVGWNYGTIAELGGGVKDVPASLRGIQSGEGISHRTAYSLSLVMGTALYGAMYGALGGNPPQELKDYFFPRTGRKRKDGSDDRVSLPTYMRDVAALLNRADEFPFSTSSNLWHMAKSKLHPLFSTVAEMLDNKDYYGAAIRNPNAPLVQQAGDWVKHILKAFLPISARAYMQQQQTGATPMESLRGFVGITPAPGYVTNTSEQQRARESQRRIELTPLERRRRMGLR